MRWVSSLHWLANTDWINIPPLARMSLVGFKEEVARRGLLGFILAVARITHLVFKYPLARTSTLGFTTSLACSPLARMYQMGYTA